jgi:N-methylhydantoinase A
MLPGVPISLSSEILPEIREYERATTTANAFVQPLMAGYLERFARGLRAQGARTSVFIMLSSGGIASPDVARRFPVRVVDSGPAAGAIAAATVGEQVGARRVLSFDMGGTTAKTCLTQKSISPDSTVTLSMGVCCRYLP